MVFSRVVGLAGCILVLGGCSTMMAGQATKQLAAQCAEQGENMRFLPGETRRSDNPIYSSASVSGMCIGPDHPEYENAIAPED